MAFPFCGLRRALGTCVNVHPSLLPRWRGPAPLFWWLRSGETRTGVSVHAMTAHADAGPVLARGVLAPPWQADGATLLTLAGQLGAQLLPRALQAPALGAASAQAPVAGPAPGPVDAPRPTSRDALVQPASWPAEALLRYASGAPYFCRPHLYVGDRRFALAGGVGTLPPGSLPGDYAVQGDVLWVHARDADVALRLHDVPNPPGRRTLALPLWSQLA